MSLLQTEQVEIRINQKTICQRLDLCIEPGQIWAILGQNGVGKTTLLHSIAGLHATSAGKILLQNICITQHSRVKMAQSIAVLLQHYEDVFPTTVRDTLSMSRYPHLPRWQNESTQDRQIVENLLHDFDLIALQNRLVTTLSGGERQRLRIAAVLAQTPQLLLLDEPLNHLDLHYQIYLLNYLVQHAANNNQAIMMALQDINYANRFCSHIIMLFKDGKVLLGERQQLMQTQLLSDCFKQRLTLITNENGSVWQAI